MVVEVYKVVKGEVQRVAEVRLAEGSLVIYDHAGGIAKFLVRFVCRAPDGKKLTYEDGEAWLWALPDNLRGTYLWAEEQSLGAETLALHEASVFSFDESLVKRDQKGRFAEQAGGGLLGKLEHLTSFDDLSDGDVTALGQHLEDLFGDLLDKPDRFDPPQGDRYLAALAKERGFDGPPQIVDEVPDGPDLRARGLKPLGGNDPEAWADQFRSGTLFEGEGLAGSGTYVARGEQAFNDATWYAAKGGVVLRMQPKGFMTPIRLRDLYHSLMKSAHAALGRGDLTDRQKKALEKAFTNPGRIATLLGYDEIDTATFSVLLNRTAVKVQRSSVRVTWEPRDPDDTKPTGKLDSDA